MSIEANQDIKDFIHEIIKKNKFEPTAKVYYTPGSELGDGYLSKTLAVSISDDKDTLELFIKCVVDIKSEEILPIDRFYANEIYFYEVIQPAYQRFLEERNLGNDLLKVPKCYGTSTKNIIALNNVRKNGFKLYDRTRPLNEGHITLAFKTIAKFHAIGFAMKDQERERYQKLVSSLVDLFGPEENEYYVRSRKEAVDELLACFDPAVDQYVLDGTVDLADKLNEVMKSSNDTANEYCVLNQGDCWVNNLMFLCEGENPIDMVLVDWQMARVSLPVFDLAYFFYTSASEEALANLKHYLKVYYDELSDGIRKLGSDPQLVYPFGVFERHWKEHAKYGLALAFILIRLMLSTTNEVINVQNIDTENKEDKGLFRKIENDDEYIRRMKILTRHMVDNDFF